LLNICVCEKEIHSLFLTFLFTPCTMCIDHRHILMKLFTFCCKKLLIEFFTVDFLCLTHLKHVSKKVKKKRNVSCMCMTILCDESALDFVKSLKIKEGMIYQI